MRTTDAPSKMEGIALSKIDIVAGGAGDFSLKVRANLVSNNGEIHGTTERVGGWSGSVLRATHEFIDALERHLMSIHFEIGEEEDGKSAERDTPKGILGT